jgi:hypothetical protein
MSLSRIANRYFVEEQLACGGMGVVYRVRDGSSGEAVALKRLAPGLSDRKDLVEAFEREYQVLAGLDHPRIIRVFEYGVEGAGPYYTMELLAGRDMREAAPLPCRAACGYLRDVATSLALLHTRRLLHRDLSPGNVRMTEDGHCKLLDFGALAAFGQSDLVVGTPSVVPPEALAGAPLDQRSDLYSLGALAYWMLTGRHAHPARTFDELPELWKQPPPAPSVLATDVSEGLDELVLSLLNADPSGRPGSAAEVISRLNLLANLETDGAEEEARLAESFLVRPRFVGRAAPLAQIQAGIQALVNGQGGAVRIEGAEGTGRSRLLEEVELRAQVAGAAVVRVDASMVRDWNGTARALVLDVLSTLPRLSREHAAAHRTALANLGREVDEKIAASDSVPPGSSGRQGLRVIGVAASASEASRGGGGLDAWFTTISRNKPLVLEVDNVEDADDVSLGLLVVLARAAAQSSLLLVVTETTRHGQRDAPGLVTLRSLCERVVLTEMSAVETRELCRSIFGDAPNLERFAGWLHGHTAGSPSYGIETLRRLVADRALRHIDGMWVLPADRPDAKLPGDLRKVLLARVASLGDAARRVAGCLCLVREQPTTALIRLLVDDPDDRQVLQVIDELARSGVLYADRGGFRFASAALREALLSELDPSERTAMHRRVGASLAQLAEPGDLPLRIEAGWHLIKGGDDLRGAEMIAEVTHDNAATQRLIVNLHHVGSAVEASLQVYRRHRRSVYERAPLLAALGPAAYAEDHTWADRYGDEALDACEDLAGVRTAGMLRRFVGRWPALLFGIALAWIRFHLTPRRERGYRFREVLVQLFGTVTTLAATAAIVLDAARAERIARIIEVFSALPARLAPTGIYTFALGMREIGRERQPQAYRTFETLLRRFGDRRYYRELPDDMRLLCFMGAHFIRGVFATMRADGRAALESADALESSGIRLFAMMACHVRFLYHAYRGELAKGAVHREQVDVHAAHLGSAWQVETWEPAALIPVASRLRDVVALTRIVDRLDRLRGIVPSLDLYWQLGRLALERARGAHRIAEQGAVLIESLEPRSFIGWAHAIAVLARSANEQGDHAQARRLCEHGLAHVTDEDREFVALFLDLDIEMAGALAGLGEVDAALARIDGLLARFEGCDHPLAMGSLHEARARITWKAGRVAEYVLSLSKVERWFRATATSALVAKIERLAELQTVRNRDVAPHGIEVAAPDVTTIERVDRPPQEAARSDDHESPHEEPPKRGTA